jgi:Low molecular weight phosphotyrosine protein phosphatase
MDGGRLYGPKQPQYSSLPSRSLGCCRRRLGGGWTVGGHAATIRCDRRAAAGQPQYVDWRSDLPTGTGMAGPLFVCHANCSRSVFACYLYRHLCNNAPAHSAGLEPGERISERVETLLREWGIEASGHRPSKVSRDLCIGADAIFVMAPPICIACSGNTAKTLRTRRTCSRIRSQSQCLSATASTEFTILRLMIERLVNCCRDSRGCASGYCKSALRCSGTAGGLSQRASTWSYARPSIEQAIDAHGRNWKRAPA